MTRFTKLAFLAAVLSGYPATAQDSTFVGSKAGDERQVAGVKLCWCPPGRFTMGSPPGEPERRPGESQVEVRLTQGFWIGKFEVTQGDWKRVVGELPGKLTAELPDGDAYPVGNVNFAEAEGFCRILTELGIARKELPGDWEFRLPTESQWEYACRAGTTTATAFGDSLSRRQANFQGKPFNGGADDGPSLKRATRVGSYAPNAWGVHDMHGNTFEWCRDWYHATLPGGDDPDLYSAKAASRVRRGGCWADEGWPCRSAFRLRFEPERRYDHIGFRVVAVRLIDPFLSRKSRDREPTMRLLAALAVLATLEVADSPSPTPTLDRLGVEASKSKAEFPDRWAGYQDQVDRSVENHAKLVAVWRNRNSPPPLDLKPLGLPLVFLVAEARRLGEAPDAIDPKEQGKMAGLPPVRFERGRSERHSAYLDAIASHPDDRRIEVLVEYRDALERRWPGIGRSIPWPRLLAQAATRDWAVGRVRDLAREAPAFDPSYPIDVLPFRLIDRFAGDLPPDAATIAYDYLRAQDPHGPRNGERTWDVLLRLDPRRARREILPYFHSFKSQAFDFNIYVVMLLVKHAGPSAELAREARTWLAKDNIDPGFRRDIRVILLRADPDHEVKPAVEHVDRLLAERARKGEMVPFQGDVHYLVLALGEVNSKEADDALARYVFERPIPDGIRALALESLARRAYPGTPALLARWLAEESPHMRDYVRKKVVEEWGDSGRRLLERVDRER